MSLSNKGKQLKLRHYDISTFPRNSLETHLHRLPAEDRQKYGEDKSWQIDQDHVFM